MRGHPKRRRAPPRGPGSRRNEMLSGVINTNVSALYALNSLENTANTTNTLEQQLSSGLAINSPADNPAGYISAQGFTAQISGVTQAISNANQAVSLVQTANGAINQQVNILQSIQSIANQAANGTATAAQLASLQQVVSSLTAQVSTIANQTNFNGLSLLDGTFQGVQFQVGAQAGQTIGFSIGSTAANQIGAYQSSAAGSGVYVANGVGTGGVADTTGSSYAITASGAGAFTAGSFGVSGSNGSALVTVTANQSAQSVAQSINAVTNKTNVTASANTSVAFTVTAGSISFKLGNGTGTPGTQTNVANVSATVTSVTQSGLANLVSSINQQAGTTGVTASVDASNHLVLTQSQGDNISITGYSGTGTLAAGGTSTITLSGAAQEATIQGLVTVQSNQSFAFGSTASDIGLGTSSALKALSSINVSTQAGAGAAINILSYALQQLENQGGQLGAVQQRLQATVANLQVTNTNLTAARGVVQDANIPQVTTQLTQAEILQQAGVSALSRSSQLQQSLLKLLQ
ncbi:MAG TPA: flagellin [Stellaceae bacterium]|nr:flagellin [Stellaceae bacterium]